MNRRQVISQFVVYGALVAALCLILLPVWRYLTVDLTLRSFIDPLILMSLLIIVAYCAQYGRKTLPQITAIIVLLVRLMIVVGLGTALLVETIRTADTLSTSLVDAALRDAIFVVAAPRDSLRVLWQTGLEALLLALGTGFQLQRLRRMRSEKRWMMIRRTLDDDQPQ